MKKSTKPVARKSPPGNARKSPADNHLRPVISTPQIQKRLRELAGQINRDYRGKTLHVVGVLENAFVFMADLIRALKMPVYCDFVRADIRDTSQGGIATREITYTPRVEAAGKDILLVEGILQSGMTMDHLYRYLLGQNPTSVRTVCLIEKTDERKVDVPTDYVGFRATGKFLVGYGLGYEGRFKNLPYVAAVPSTPRR
ncbi:MAG: hypoxanthine phosphoribosyltransferase [Acidobacteriia bacterium]|nr:hypoxanthine phosphoribosyltransferase [Terriglobia bacterium]